MTEYERLTRRWAKIDKRLDWALVAGMAFLFGAVIWAMYVWILKWPGI